jgi:uncharacterized protein (TIGR03437 family)
VTATINSINVPVQFAGPQPSFAGLDQVNVLLTLNLRGAGEVPVVVTVDGKPSNTVTVNIQSRTVSSSLASAEPSPS